MSNNYLSDNYNIEFESGFSNSYLVVKGKSQLDILQYQVEMLTNNDIPGILPVGIRQSNNIIGLYYNVTSRITLSLYLGRHKFTKNEFIVLILNILKTLTESRKFLLSDNCFILDEEYIYLNPSTEAVYLLYLPTHRNINITAEFKNLILRLIVDKAKFDDSSNDSFLQKILEFVRTDSFTLTDFYSFLEELKDSRMPEYLEEIIKPAQEIVKEQKQTDYNKRSSSINTVDEMLKPHDLSASGTVQKEKETEQKINDDKKLELVKLFKANRAVLLSALIQVLVVIVFFIGKGYLMAITGDKISAYAGTGLVLVALDFMVMRKIFEKNDSVAVNVNTSKRSVVSDINVPYAGEEIKRQRNSWPSENDNIIKPKNKAVVIPCSPARIEANNDYQADIAELETAVLSENEVEEAYLSYKHDGIEDRISISKDSFFIGRLGEQVDYILANNAVGKVHAEIRKRGSNYFLVDMNSRNGTFVNGDQIISNVEEEIKNGDNIRFANVNFTFTAHEKRECV